MRDKFHTSLIKFRTEQISMYPLLAEELQISSVDCLRPENESLFLPSDLTIPHIKKLGLDSIAKTEYRIREGQAHDCLEEVRRCIQSYNHHIAAKAKTVHGQRHATRARVIVDNLVADIHKAADSYNNSRNALLRLGLDPADTILQNLPRTDLWAKNTALAPNVSDSRREDPWFWHTSCPAGMSAEEKKEFNLESMY